MKLIPPQAGLPFGITAFQFGIGVVSGVACLAMTQIFLYSLTVRTESYSNASFAGPIPFDVASRIAAPSFHISGFRAANELKIVSELHGLEEQDGQKDATEKDGSSEDGFIDEASSSTGATGSEDSENPEVPVATLSEGAPERDLLGPFRSQLRAVRALRFGVFISSILLCMLTVVVLLKVNRLSHAKYAGRLWWIGLIVIPGWLLAGLMVAWNNEIWDSMFDAQVW